MSSTTAVNTTAATATSATSATSAAAPAEAVTPGATTTRSAQSRAVPTSTNTATPTSTGAEAGAPAAGAAAHLEEWPGLGPDYDRAVPEVASPPLAPLTSAELYDGDNKIRLDVLKDHLTREGRLAEECIYRLLDEADAMFRSYPNILELRYPITVVGDIHGQYFDLLRLFEVGGDPSETQYLFLGDYVDRGNFSTEVLFFVLALKITYPQTFHMIRGNHECRQLTAFFNFRDECSYKYNLALYDAFMECFDHLPLGALINRSFFCVHGGLSPDISTLDEIRNMNRHREIPREGAMCDLLWSDPFEVVEPSTQTTPSTSTTPKAQTVVAGAGAGAGAGTGVGTTWYGYNETRQCSYVFGVEAVKRFLKDNRLTSIIRAHEAQLDGYKMQMINKASGIPRVITIFSAPNYCDVYKNKGACLKFDKNVLNIKQFVESEHPYYLPNFLNVFEWSMPFMAEKVTDILVNILEYDDPALDLSGLNVTESELLRRKGGLFKKKVMAVTKMLRVYRTLREENEAIVHLKQLVPNQKIPFGLLREGPEAIQRAISSFEEAQKADKPNEAMPPE